MKFRFKKFCAPLLVILLVITPSMSYSLSWPTLSLSRLFSTLYHALMGKSDQAPIASKPPLFKYPAQVPTVQKPSSFKYHDYQAWKKACKKLPSFIKGGHSYKNTALDWGEFQIALERFFDANKRWYAKHAALWTKKNPASNSDFFDLNKSVFVPFVQKLVVKPQTIIAIRGDLHGDIHSLLAYIDFMQDAGYMNGFTIVKDNFRMLFLGDYVDRGNYGVEVLYTLMRLKIANPETVVLVRGNHEDINVCSHFGFLQEVRAKFGTQVNFSRITRLYDFLPVALYLGSGNDTHKDFLQCCHGGMEVGFNPQSILATTENIAFEWLGSLHQATEFRQLHIDHQACEARSHLKDFKVTSHMDIGFMWNDFHVADDGLLLGYKPGRGFVYGKKMTQAVLQQASSHTHKIRGVLRAHQHTNTINDPMMASILDPKNETDHKGLSKLWKDAKTAQGKSLWDGIVCTFLVAPDTGYSCGGSLFDFDAFALLTTADTFDQWKLKVHRTPLATILKN